MRNAANLKQPPLRPGKVITAARIQTLEYQRGTDKHLPVLFKGPHLNLHLGFGKVDIMQLLHLLRELVVRIAVLSTTRPKHGLKDVLHRRAFVHIVIIAVVPGNLAGDIRDTFPPHFILITLHSFWPKIAKNLENVKPKVASNTIFVFLTKYSLTFSLKQF
jgi:hypothetical protein